MYSRFKQSHLKPLALTCSMAPSALIILVRSFVSWTNARVCYLHMFPKLSLVCSTHVFFRCDALTLFPSPLITANKATNSVFYSFIFSKATYLNKR